MVGGNAARRVTPGASRVHLVQIRRLHPDGCSLGAACLEDSAAMWTYPRNHVGQRGHMLLDGLMRSLANARARGWDRVVERGRRR